MERQTTSVVLCRSAFCAICEFCYSLSGKLTEGLCSLKNVIKLPPSRQTAPPPFTQRRRKNGKCFLHNIKPCAFNIAVFHKKRCPSLSRLGQRAFKRKFTRNFCNTIAVLQQGHFTFPRTQQFPRAYHSMSRRRKRSLKKECSDRFLLW